MTDNAHNHNSLVTSFLKLKLIKFKLNQPDGRHEMHVGWVKHVFSVSWKLVDADAISPNNLTSVEQVTMHIYHKMTNNNW